MLLMKRHRDRWHMVPVGLLHNTGKWSCEGHADIHGKSLSMSSSNGDVGSPPARQRSVKVHSKAPVNPAPSVNRKFAKNGGSTTNFTRKHLQDIAAARWPGRLPVSVNSTLKTAVLRMLILGYSYSLLSTQSSVSGV